MKESRETLNAIESSKRDASAKRPRLSSFPKIVMVTTNWTPETSRRCFEFTPRHHKEIPSQATPGISLLDELKDRELTGNDGHGQEANT